MAENYRLKTTIKKDGFKDKIIELTGSHPDLIKQRIMKENQGYIMHDVEIFDIRKIETYWKSSNSLDVNKSWKKELLK